MNCTGFNVTVQMLSFNVACQRRNPQTKEELEAIFKRCHPADLHPELPISPSCRLCTRFSEASAEIQGRVFSQAIQEEQPRTIHHLTKIYERLITRPDRTSPEMLTFYERESRKIITAAEKEKVLADIGFTARGDSAAREFLGQITGATQIEQIESVYERIRAKYQLGNRTTTLRIGFDAVLEKYEELIQQHAKHAEAQHKSQGHYVMPFKMAIATPQSLLQKAIQAVQKGTNFSPFAEPAASFTPQDRSPNSAESDTREDGCRGPSGASAATKLPAPFTSGLETLPVFPKRPVKGHQYPQHSYTPFLLDRLDPSKDGLTDADIEAMALSDNDDDFLELTAEMHLAMAEAEKE